MDSKQHESSMRAGGNNNNNNNNNTNDSSSNPISEELNNGMQIARQLQMLLSNPNCQNMDALREQLLQGIIGSFDRAVTIVQQNERSSSGSMMMDSPGPGSYMSGMGAAADSPSMVSGATGGDGWGGGSCQGESTAVDHRSKRVDPGEGSSKRKTENRWVKIVQATHESGFEAPINDDGYTWRKYGQKEINGAKYQRAYYRCTLKPQGCNAKKQVQRSEKDTSMFIVTYRGKHTCHNNYQSQVLPPTSSSPPSSSSGTILCSYPTYPPASNRDSPSPHHQTEKLISFKSWPTHQQQQGNIYLDQFSKPQHPSSSGSNTPMFFPGSSSNNDSPAVQSINQPQPPPALQEPSLPSARMDQGDPRSINEHSSGQHHLLASQPQGGMRMPGELQPGHPVDTDYDSFLGMIVEDFPFNQSNDDFDPSVYYH